MRRSGSSGALAAAASLLLASCTGSGAPDVAAQAREQIRVAQDPAAMMRIAAAAEQAGDHVGAGAFYQRAADLNPGSSLAEIGVARTLVEQDRSDEAIAVLKTAHAEAPGDDTIAATLGRLLIAEHRPDEALKAFRDGLASSPHSVSLLIGQGVALDARRLHASAQQSYRAALALDPANVAARNNLALSLALSGDPDQGASMLSSLLPSVDAADRATVDGNLALSYGLAGDNARAQQTARTSLPEPDVANNLRFYAALRHQGVSSGLPVVADPVAPVAAPVPDVTPGKADDGVPVAPP